jgi:hypothetical protein
MAHDCLPRRPVEDWGQAMMDNGRHVRLNDEWKYNPISLAGNSPEAFSAMPELKQRSLRRWIQLALTRAEPYTGNYGRWHSYNLKHHAECAVRFGVSNGERKGAMLAEGYDAYPEDLEDINWRFLCKPRCPHRMRRVNGIYQFACPAALFVDSLYRQYDGLVTGTYPALCQATDVQFAGFYGLCLEAREVAS